MNAHTDTYGALATRCERAADSLAREATQTDAPVAAARKVAAAAAAREFAAGLRAEAAASGLDARPSADRVAVAERVILAAGMGGYLIDGRRLAKAATTSTYGRAERAAWDAGTHPAQLEAAEMEAAGVFTLVDEIVHGQPQVAYWELGAAQLDAAIAAEDAAEDDPVDPLDPDERTTCHGCRAWATVAHLASDRHHQ